MLRFVWKKVLRVRCLQILFRDFFRSLLRGKTIGILIYKNHIIKNSFSHLHCDGKVERSGPYTQTHRAHSITISVHRGQSESVLE